MTFSSKFDQFIAGLLLCGYFFIPIAPAPVHIAIFSSLVLSFLSRNIRERYKAMFSEKVFRWFFIFYGVLVISSLYGSGGVELKLHYLGKYLELGYMPLMAAICFGKDYREKSLQLFSITMLITLLLSYAIFFGFDFGELKRALKIVGTTSNPTIFKLQITHNFFMAFAVFLWLQKAQSKADIYSKILYCSLSILGLVNIILMVEGRTGYLTLLAIGSAYIFDRISVKKLTIGILLALIFSGGIYKISPKVQSRVDQAVSEVSEWRPGVRSETSMGLRIEFWFNSYELIKKAPMLGFGVAGFETEYYKIANALNLTGSINPHNQYLLFLSQIGLLGLLVFVYLNYVIWSQSVRLEKSWRIWVRAIILGYAAANIFNSMLLDFAEGIFFSTSLAIAFSGLFADQASATKKEG